MQMTLFGFLWSGFTHWMADDRSLVVVKHPDALYEVEWPLEGRVQSNLGIAWVRHNLDCDLGGLARKLSYEAPGFTRVLPSVTFQAHLRTLP